MRKLILSFLNCWGANPTFQPLLEKEVGEASPQDGFTVLLQSVSLGGVQQEFFLFFFFFFAEHLPCARARAGSCRERIAPDSLPFSFFYHPWCPQRPRWNWLIRYFPLSPRHLFAELKMHRITLTFPTGSYFPSLFHPLSCFPLNYIQFITFFSFSFWKHDAQNWTQPSN